MGKYFGTDGFRAEAGVGLSAEAALSCGKALGEYLKRRGAVLHAVIGKDTRCSSDMLEAALAAGLAASGVEVALAGVIPTAAISYLTERCAFGIGVMISASHNPFYDNGIKVIGKTGEKLPDTDEAEIEELIDTGTPSATRERIGGISDMTQGREYYCAHLTSSARIRLDGLRIGLDAASGAAYLIAEQVLSALGATVVRYDPMPNGININGGTGSTHPEGLAQLVKEEGLDLGIALDGDADRCIPTDEHGNVLSGDHVLYLLAREMQADGKLRHGKVVATVMSNLGLTHALGKLGISTTMTAVGDRYVYERMCEGGYSLGGEQSGHIIISDYEHTGDGILTAIKLAEIVKKSNAPLSTLTAPLIMLPQKTQSIKVRDKGVIDSPRVKKTLLDAERALADGGRVILRKSGTEPVVRITVEAESESISDDVTSMLAEAVKREDALMAESTESGKAGEENDA